MNICAAKHLRLGNWKKTATNNKPPTLEKMYSILNKQNLYRKWHHHQQQQTNKPVQQANQPTHQPTNHNFELKQKNNNKWRTIIVAICSSFCAKRFQLSNFASEPWVWSRFCLKRGGMDTPVSSHLLYKLVKFWAFYRGKLLGGVYDWWILTI